MSCSCLHAPVHCSSREYTAALEWLSWALDKHPDNPHLLSRVAHVQLGMGDINAAASTFQVPLI